MNLVDYMAQIAEQLEQHPGPATEPLFFWTWFKTSKFWGCHLVNGPEKHIRINTVLPPKTKEAHKALCLFFGCNNGQM